MKSGKHTIVLVVTIWIVAGPQCGSIRGGNATLPGQHTLLPHQAIWLRVSGIYLLSHASDMAADEMLVVAAFTETYRHERALGRQPVTNSVSFCRLVRAI